MTYWLFFHDLVTENTKMPKKIGCRFRHYWQTITVNLGDFTFNGYAYCVIKPDKMSTCKVCNKRRTRSLCLDDATNICKDIFNSGNYEVTITDDAEVLHESLISENQLYSPPVHCKKDPPAIINDNSLPSISSTIDCTLNTQDNYKDALLAALYSQVEFLRNELNEKNLLIRTLIIRESDVYNYPTNTSQN